MAKATLTLPNGTVVTVEGKPQEVKELLSLYGGSTAEATPKRTKSRAPAKIKRKKAAKPEQTPTKPRVAEIVNLIKDCDEAEAIGHAILDRSSQVDRTLLPLYIVHKYLDNEFAITSGDIHKITKDLGIPISTPNASKALSGTASRYVIGDRRKVKGRAVRYKLSRRGLTYLSNVISGAEDG